MPVSQMRNGLTAENSLFSQKPSIKVPRSRFDLGRLNCFTADIGAIVPVDHFLVMPNDEFDPSCQYKIDFRPLIVPTLTSYKVKVHYYYCKFEDLWSGWETFISKGRSGNLALTVPSIGVSSLCSTTAKLTGLTDPNFKTEDGTYYPYSANSLLGYMLGSVPYDSDASASGFVNDHYLPYIDSANTPVATGFKSVDSSALPFLMYQKIYRSNYLDPNLMSNSTVESQVWFPDDIDSTHWRIDYAKTNIGGDNNCFFVPQGQSFPDSGNYRSNFVPIPNQIGASDDGVSDNAVNLVQLRYSMFTDDMFTTALPFLQRGTPAFLNFNDLPGGAFLQSLGKFQLGLPDADSGHPVATGVSNGHTVIGSTTGVSENAVNYNLFQLYSSLGKGVYPVVADIQQEGDSSLPGGGLKLGFNAQMLRNLIAVSVWQERNALTNGSYGQFIKVHFNEYPGNQYCEPIYIGGTTSVFNVNAVLQTSASPLPDEKGTPQGNPVGVGGSSNSNRVGHFRAPDWGMIMVLMTIIPDSVYVQNQDHLQFDVSPDDFYMPEFEGLSYQPILNKQLYVSGDDDVDNDLFGYSNRYVYMKQRDSIARGRIGLPSDIDAYYHSYVQSRVFKDTPKLTQQFVTVYPPNIDRSMLACPGEPAFICQFYSGVNAVRPMSYVTQPNTFGF